MVERTTQLCGVPVTVPAVAATVQLALFSADALLQAHQRRRFPVRVAHQKQMRSVQHPCRAAVIAMRGLHLVRQQGNYCFAHVMFAAGLMFLMSLLLYYPTLRLVVLLCRLLCTGRLHALCMLGLPRWVCHLISSYIQLKLMPLLLHASLLNLRMLLGPGRCAAVLRCSPCLSGVP